MSAGRVLVGRCGMRVGRGHVACPWAGEGRRGPGSRKPGCGVPDSPVLAPSASRKALHHMRGGQCSFPVICAAGSHTGFRHGEFLDPRKHAFMLHPVLYVWSKAVTALAAEILLELFQQAVDLRPPDPRTGIW